MSSSLGIVIAGHHLNMFKELVEARASEQSQCLFERVSASSLNRLVQHHDLSVTQESAWEGQPLPLEALLDRQPRAFSANDGLSVSSTWIDRDLHSCVKRLFLPESAQGKREEDEASEMSPPFFWPPRDTVSLQGQTYFFTDFFQQDKDWEGSAPPT